MIVYDGEERILSCPICGKQPTFLRTGYQRYMAKCNRWFRKPDFVVYADYQNQLIRLWNNAINNWCSASLSDE